MAPRISTRGRRALFLARQRTRAQPVALGPTRKLKWRRTSRGASGRPMHPSRAVLRRGRKEARALTFMFPWPSGLSSMVCPPASARSDAQPTAQATSSTSAAAAHRTRPRVAAAAPTARSTISPRVLRQCSHRFARVLWRAAPATRSVCIPPRLRSPPQLSLRLGATASERARWELARGVGNAGYATRRGGRRDGDGDSSPRQARGRSRWFTSCCLI